METKVNFICCDMPTIHILAAVAEAEGKAISERTKAARGTLLGAQNPTIRAAAGRAHRKRDLMPEIWELRAYGCSYQSVADHFNERHILNKAGRPWNRQLVYALLKRYPSARFFVEKVPSNY